MFSAIYGTFATIITINIILSIFVVFFDRRNPTSTWVWIIVLVMLPFAGFFIYLLFGQDIRKQRKFIRKNRVDKQLKEEFFATLNNGYYNKQKEIQTEAFKFRHFDLVPGSFDDFRLSDLAYHNLQCDGGVLTLDNEVKVFNNGLDKFAALIEDINKAEKYIHMQYYIINNDGLGKEVLAALAKKAEAGLEVKLLYDGMGCMNTKKELFEPLRKAGGELVNFLPPSVPPFSIRINYRNHRKLVVIDGETGYIGGINVGDEYLGKSEKFGFWRDMHIRVKGSLVDQIQLRFIKDWNFAAKHEKIKPNEKHFPKRESGYSGTMMQLVSSGPDTDQENIKNLYFKMMNEAEKSIYFTSPYFVPDESILTALKVAGLSGLDVRLIFPGRPDHPFVYWASLSYVSELLSCGVKCYQYEKGFIHSKMLVVDGYVSSIGTANMDIRSFALNFETNAVMYSKEIGEMLNRQFYIDQEDSVEITEQWYNSRPKISRVKEAFSRLISPLL